MLTDRKAGCDGGKMHLEQWLKRGNQLRATVAAHTSKERKEQYHNSLTRCRSLELLDENQLTKRLNQSASGVGIGRSFDMLDSTQHAVMVHHGHDDDVNTQRSSSLQQSSNPSGSDMHQRHNCRKKWSGEDRKSTDFGNLSLSERDKHSSAEQYDSDFNRRKTKLYDKNAALSVAERLEELLSKTNEIIQMERLTRQKIKETNPITEMRNHSSKLNEGRLKVSTSSQKEKIRNGMDYENGLIKKFERLDYSYPTEQKNETFTDSSQKNITSKSNKDNGHTIQSDSKNSHKIESSDRSSGLSDESHHKPNYKKISRKINGFFHSSDKERNNNDTVSNNINEEDKNFMLKQCQGNYYQTDTIDADVSATESASQGKSMQAFTNGFFQNACFEDVSNSSSSTTKSVKFQNSPSIGIDEVDSRTDLPEMANMKELYELKSRILNGAHWRSQVLRKSAQDVNKLAAEANAGSKTAEVEDSDQLENSKIAANGDSDQLSSQKSKINELIAKFQVPSKSVTFMENHDDESESSEDDWETDVESNQNQESESSVVPSVQNGIHFNKNKKLVPLKVGSVLVSNKRSTSNSKPFPIIGPKPLKIPIEVKRFSTEQTQPLIVRKTLDTRSLIPKDAYFHDIPKKLQDDKSSSPVNLANRSADQSQNQSAYAGTSDDETLTPSQPPPLILPNYLNNNKIHQMYMNQIAQSNNHNNNTSIASSSPLNMFAGREKLLSSRKFATTNVPSMSSTSSTDPELTQINTSTLYNGITINTTNSNTNILSNMKYKTEMQGIIDKVQLERDMHNDSGYSTKTFGPSPSLSAQTEPDLIGSCNNGLVPANSKNLVTNGNIENLTNGHQLQYNDNRDYLFTNISASSLV